MNAPLQVGDRKILSSRVHDAKDAPAVIFNHACWPGVVEGDLLRAIRTSGVEEPASGFLFVVPKDEGSVKPHLQLSIPHPIAEAFGVRNNCELLLTKETAKQVDQAKSHAQLVEFVIQDLYLGRNEMWRFSKSLVDQCVYSGQTITFTGSITVKISAIYHGNEKVSSGYVTASTRTAFRSLSAKVIIFIQICHEVYNFVCDGENYCEKVVHSFLPALFSKWKEAGTNHMVTIILMARVFYEPSEVAHAAEPLLCDEEGRPYRDFFRVIIDLEHVHEWKSIIVDLKNAFRAFRRDILLEYYPQHHLDKHVPAQPDPESCRVVGRLSDACDGPILEAVNLSLSTIETHFIDRSFSFTGSSTILITPGAGYFRVSKQLLRLTTIRLPDQGFGLDLICMRKPPLHQSPIFSFQGVEPELRMNKEGSTDAFTLDPLWAGEDDPAEVASREKATFWWEPPWMYVSFWDTQLDLPTRENRFVACARMQQIQMLGVLEREALTSVAVPFLPARPEVPFALSHHGFLPQHGPLTKQEADQFDNDIFVLTPDSTLANVARASSGSGTVIASSYRSPSERRGSVTLPRTSLVHAKSTRVPPIKESPGPIFMELPREEPSYISNASNLFANGLSTSPSQFSIRSVGSSRSVATATSLLSRGSRQRDSDFSRSSLASKFAPAWLLNPFRSTPSEPQTSTVAAISSVNVTPSTSPQVTPKIPPVRLPSLNSTAPLSRAANAPTSTVPYRSTLNSGWNIPSEENMPYSQRTPYSRQSPANTPPRSDVMRRYSTATTHLPPSAHRINPSKPRSSITEEQATLTGQWHDLYPQSQTKYRFKWQSIIMPACLPLTNDHFPTSAELESSYDVTSYDFVIDPAEMRTFLVKLPTDKGHKDEVRGAWALAVMRGMVAVRLAQGFQVIVCTLKDGRALLYHPRSLAFDDDPAQQPAGAADVLKTTKSPVYLCMSNEIHRISYTGEAIQVKRFVRRMPRLQPIKYQCLIWPKSVNGCSELRTSFSLPGLTNYGWNRMDMLVAGYEQHFSESLRYWRTRFIVIPTDEPPQANVGPSGETLNDEEMRVLGIEKLGEMFTKMRWDPAEEQFSPLPPIRLLQTTLSPAASVTDESIIAQLDEIHATGPLRKKVSSEREIGGMPLANVAMAMREDDGVPIKLHVWHKSQYPDSFTGYDFVSWLIREFRDVSSRSRAAEIGAQLMKDGLFAHCKGTHGFLDGHYFYRLGEDYAVSATPRKWFRSRQGAADINGRTPSRTSMGFKRSLILSQSMVINVDTQKRSDAAEPVILHHDIIHNPTIAFHFELQWIGTTAKLIEERVREWSTRLKPYGLRVAETYVTQISDIRDHNHFQSCSYIQLRVAPPVVPDLEKKLGGEYGPSKRYFESAILRKFGFILDTEASDMYPQDVELVHSYRRSYYDYAQFVHRSGVAFAQVLGGEKGFLILTNSLRGLGRLYRSLGSVLASARSIKLKLSAFCSDEEALRAFYREELEEIENASPLIL